MKIIRPLPYKALLAALCIALQFSTQIKSLSRDEAAAIALVKKVIEGDSEVDSRKLNVICQDLATLLSKSELVELRQLVEDYSRLDPASLNFATRLKKLKEIIDRLGSLRDRKKLPQELIDAVDSVNKIELLNRLKIMLTP